MKKKSNYSFVSYHRSLQFLLIISFLFSGCTEGDSQNQKRFWVERWGETRSLHKPRAGAAAGVYGDYIYVAGGGEADTDEGIHNSVEFTRSKPDGTLEPWRYTRKLTVPRIFAAGVVHKNFFYVIGGEKGLKDKDLLSSVERGVIGKGGKIEMWVVEDSEMATPRRAPVVFIINERLYVSGGYNGKFLTDVESAKIHPDGSLGRWRNESSDTKYPRYIHTGILFDQKIVIFGGHSPKTGGALDAIEWTSVTSDDGFLAQWEEASGMRTKRYLNGAVLHQNSVFLLGGRNSVLIRDVSRGKIEEKPGGGVSIRDWTRDSPLESPREAVSVANVGNFIYAIGGKGRGGVLPTVSFSEIRDGFNLGHWSLNPNHSSGGTDALKLDAYSHFEVGNEFIKYGKLEFAHEEIAEGLSLDSDSHEGHYLLGQYYARKGEFEKAVNSFVKALELKEDYAEPHIGLAIVHMEAGRLDVALKESEEAVSLSPKMPEAHYLAGLIYLKGRDFSKAKESLKVAIKNRRDLSEAHQSLGVVHYELKEYREAIVAYKRALVLDPDFYSARINLAACYLRLEKFQEAISEYETLLLKHPDDDRLKRLLLNARNEMASTGKSL